MAKLSLLNQVCLRWDNDLVGFSIAVSPMLRNSGSREQAAEIQSQTYRLWSLWEAAWLLDARSVSSQLCRASKAGFIPLAALVIWQWLPIASVFQQWWYSLQLHSHRVSLLTHKKTLNYLSFSPHKLTAIAFGLPESWHGHKCHLQILFQMAVFCNGKLLIQLISRSENEDQWWKGPSMPSP